MSSCLGLYIEGNIIKYAKISKEHENIKLESFGIKFDDNVINAVRQVVNETNSDKIPISVNLSDEKYTYANLFSLLNDKDLKKAINTEFDYFCKENGKNSNVLEYRYLLSPNFIQADKVLSLYAYTDKGSVASKLQTLNNYRVSNIVPLPLSITNLNKFENKNSVIINIESNTSITFIVKGKIQKVEIIDIGMKNILENIVVKEKSYSKAYEICKGTTIYTLQDKDIQLEENEHIEDIMPALYSIIEKVRKVINESEIYVENIYITGLGVAINNIDLYFQDNFPEEKCEILTPFFINKSNVRLNIKDVIEVNSAIALALEGVGLGNKNINFRNQEGADKVKELFRIDFKEALDVVEKNMVRFAVGLILLIVSYGIVSHFIINQITNKDNEIKSYIEGTQRQIVSIVNNTKLINERTTQYETFINKIKESSNMIAQSYARKNAIPNLLTEIMFNIPKEVQLISIENPSSKSINIQARSKEYEQLGYFIAKLKNEGILMNITSTSGVKQGEFVVITISGQLPY